jgi:hypothetical protein
MTDSVIEENPVADYIGIDVGAKSVEVSVRRAGRLLETRRFAQTPAGHQALIEHPAGELACGVLEGPPAFITWTWRWRSIARAGRWR